jgi:multidrug efflux pump subunit AcrA (membrane-fusion protein)
VKALNAFQVADKNYARAQDLYAHHAIAEKDLLDAESARAQSQADLQNAQQSLRVLGVNDPNSVLKSSAAPEVPLVAPLAGEVTELLVNPGQLLQAGQTRARWRSGHDPDGRISAPIPGKDFLRQRGA